MKKLIENINKILENYSITEAKKEKLSSAGKDCETIKKEFLEILKKTSIAKDYKDIVKKLEDKIDTYIDVIEKGAEKTIGNDKLSEEIQKIAKKKGFVEPTEICEILGVPKENLKTFFDDVDELITEISQEIYDYFDSYDDFKCIEDETSKVNSKIKRFLGTLGKKLGYKDSVIYKYAIQNYLWS